MTTFDPAAGFQVWALQARTDAAGDPVDDSTAAEGRLIGELVSPGVVRPSNGYVVAERGAGANMSVDIGSGSAFNDLACVQGNEPGQGRYLIRLGDGVTNVTVDAADVSNPRIDQVFLVVFENSLDSSGRTMARFFVRKGTAASSPSAPGPDGAWTAYLLLADVLVGAGVTDIETADITDQRALASADLTGAAMVPTGGIIDYVGSGVPAGWLGMDGGSYSQATYLNLWKVAGPAGSGVLTDAGGGNFTMPDTRRRFRIGQGSGLALGAVGGSFDHVHTGPSHTHSGPSHTHSGPSHSHGNPGTGLALVGSGLGSADHGLISRSFVNDHGHGSTGGHTHTNPSTSFTGNHNHLGAVSADGGHLHAQGSTGSAGAHDHGTATGGGNARTHNHGQGSTDAAGTGNTGSSGTGNTGSAGTGNTGANNPPFLAVTTIIKT